MVVALIALGVALGGSAVAGTGLITGTQIKDHSVGINDLSRDAVVRLRGQRGLPGKQGHPGATGEAGPAGPAGPGFDLSKVSLVATPSFLPSGGWAYVSAQCPANARVVGGGFQGP